MVKENYHKKYIAKQDLQKTSRRSDLMGLCLVLHCWGSIVLIAVATIIWPNIFTFTAAFFLIGGRQLGMAILMHDAAHGILFRSPRLNKWIGQYVLSYPIGNDMFAYRQYHLKHHRYTQTSDDPDLPLSSAFPVSRQSMARKFARDLSGLTGLKLRFGQLYMSFRAFKDRASKQDQQGDRQLFNVRNIAAPFILNGIMFGVCYALGYGWAYFVFWLLPLLTSFQLVLRIRNIAEHAMTANTQNPLTHARTTHANLLARIFVAPYWVNYHVEHHAYMFVPCWQLKRLHHMMKEAGHLPDMETKPSYLSVLKLATTLP